MDQQTVLRVARQTAGLSQRQVAQLARVPKSTLADAELGKRALTTAQLDRVLEACALDLELVRRGTGMLDEGELAVLAEHLRLSLAQRLYLTLGGTGDCRTGPFPAAFAGLYKTWFHRVRDEVAVGVWVPGHRLPEGDVLAGPIDVEEHLVTVRPAAWTRVCVPTPLDLALRTPSDEDRRWLQAAAAMLAMTASRDQGNRRPPPHRTPDEGLETTNLLRSLTYAMHPVSELPDVRDSRGWRLEQPVSLAQLLRREGMPPRKGSERAG